MGRKLATLFLPVVMGYSATGMALGLGGIETESSLNEPFAARIALRSANEAELQDLRISLGSQEAFQRAGMSRSFMLSQLRFEVVRDGDPPYIEVTSSGPVREPFLDFLVEARWPQGRLLREYTVLLDPPLYSAEAEVPATREPTVSAQADTADQGDGSGSGSGSGAASVTTAVGAEREDPVPSADGSDAGFGENYGPVRSDQTLYRIASEVRPEGVSVNQAMLALLRANPEAFMDGNINRLRRGAVLRIPERDEFTATTASAATAEVREQMASWRAGQSVAAGQAPLPADQQDDAAAAGEEPVGQTGATAAADAEPSEEAGQEQSESAEQSADEARVADAESTDSEGDAQTGSQLSVVAPDDGAAADGSAGIDEDAAAGEVDTAALRSRMTLLEEMNASLESENADLRGQVASLKEELIELERMINLRLDESLASGVEGDAPSATEEPSQADDTPVSASGEGDTEDGAAAGNTEPSTDDAEVAAAQTEPQTTPADDPEEAATAQPEESLLASLTSNTQLMSLGGGAIVALLLLALVLRRRRGDDDALEEDLEPVAVGAGTAAAPAPGAETRDADAVAVTPEPRFGDEAAAPGVAAEAQVEESDALEQAELYVALGNHEKAQEILDDALGAEPDDPALRLKLLEVLAERGDRAGFESEAQVFHTQVESREDPRWQSVVEMGRRIAPEHPLFAEPGEALASAADEGGDDAFDMDVGEPVRDEASAEFREGVSSPAPEVGGDESDDDTDFDLDFDLDDEQPEHRPAAETPSPERDTDFDLDFALDDDERAPAVDQSASTDSGGRATDDADGLDFDIPEALGVPAEGSGQARAGDLDDDDLDFGDLEFEAPPERGEGAGSADTGRADEEDFDLDALDEAGTKLDLARAYLDMGDADGARSLLDEVAEEGSESQKQEAESLRQQAG